MENATKPRTPRRREPSSPGSPQPHHRHGGRSRTLAGLALAILALSVLVTAPFLASPLFTGTASARVLPERGSVLTAPSVDAAALPGCALSSLPPEAAETLDLIYAGGPFPYDQDGTVFQNREGLLPAEPIGYYREYTVPTPGSPDRGARRIVAGGDQPTDPDVAYYTADHYASFCEIDGTGGTPDPVGECALADLPAQVAETVSLVRAGGPFPYDQDGTTYENRESLLPDQDLGYYRVYTVPTPGAPDRGDRRLVAGGAQPTDPSALYYTADHYASFCQITG
ncbi:ribonuclease domain-containing protein [Actinopolymorpha sp. B17G11]|uniref:ribonuclease domain-containing protein n=1 Tax=Actinopolymorpha sp. B17G11 TaxID=3160861 RepID=UPI0032E45D92